MRLFTAIELPEPEKKRLFADVRSRLRDWFRLDADKLSWVASANLHVTLKFLGEVPEGPAVHAVRAALSAIEPCGPVELHIDGVTFFPERGPARVFVARVEGSGVERLVLLHHRIEAALDPLGFPREGRTFQPHVTLARVRRDRRVPGAARTFVADRPLPRGPRFEVDAFSLVESQLQPTGPVYTPVERFAL